MSFIHETALGQDINMSSELTIKTGCVCYSDQHLSCSYQPNCSSALSLFVKSGFVCVRMFDLRSHPQGKGGLYFDSVYLCVWDVELGVCGDVVLA